VASNVPPSVTITNPINGQLFTVGTGILIEAEAFDRDGTVRQVEFLVNGSSAGIVTNGPYSIVLSNLGLGSFVLTAIATHNEGATATSAPVSISVVTSPLPPSILVPPTPQTAIIGSSVTFSVLAGGTPPLFYQWYLNGTALTGATTNSLLLT